VQRETLWEELYVTPSMIRDLENRAPRWYCHIERMTEERLRKEYYTDRHKEEEEDIY
jgi:hypothetical protein